MMKHGARLAGSVCLATSVVLCLTILLYSTAHFVLPAHATRETVKGTVGSSPSSGPVGATIAISGSGWPDPDGEQVSFGYMIASYCSLVSDFQASTFHSGSFSGWLRWPNGTPLATYTVCATFGSTTALANNYTVLSEFAPQISISPSILTTGKQATIAGSNFFPAGITVQLFWETVNSSVVLGITPAISNSTGFISRTFLVPATAFASGSYKIVAIVGGGQQPTLSSSAAFTYNAPTPTPIPSPTPSPISDPTPTQHSSPTATTTAIATPGMTPTIGSTAPSDSQNITTGQTPPSGNKANTTTTSQPINTLIIVGVIGSLAILTAIITIVLLIKRKKAHSTSTGRAIGPSAGPATQGLLTWQNNQTASSVPGSMPFPTNNGSMAPIPPWPAPSANGGSMSPVPVGQVAYAHNSPPPLDAQSTLPSPPQQLQASPYVHLLQQTDGESTSLMHDHSSMPPNDPNLEAIKKQVQMGLFAAPRHHRDRAPSSTL